MKEYDATGAYLRKYTIYDLVCIVIEPIITNHVPSNHFVAT